MRIVIGIGGNTLLKREQKAEYYLQRENVKQACIAIAELAVKHEIIITHGNGPQIGLLSLQTNTYKEVSPYPFDILSAESQGMIGYLLAQELKNQLPQLKVATILTQVEVNADDPAFLKPSKFIGPIYSQQQAKKLEKQYGWEIAIDGNHYRRIVASPLPKNILELDAIQALLKEKIIPICVGGGGIPVVRNVDGAYQGIEAVIDKDFATAVMAEKLGADCLLLLTDVANVMCNWQQEDETPIYTINVEKMSPLSFAGGSMAPKVEAACQFVVNTGKIAKIGSLLAGEKILSLGCGTTILP